MFKQLLGNKVLVEKEEEKKEEERTPSGLYIPQTQSKQAMHERGTVVQIGPECETVKEDDFIIYDKMAVRSLEMNGKEYVLLNEESIVGVL